jgi:hypothetical protein
MSDPGIVMMSVSALVAAAYSVKVIASAVVRHREHDRKSAVIAATSIADDRMARLEMAVESIAVEVERISEGQRFTTRLLTEQANPIPSRLKPGKFDTPH